MRYLARWDSLLIGYDDRQRILPDEYREAVIKKNGDFLPTFLVDGFVAGLWSTDVDGTGAVLRLEPFTELTSRTRAELEEEGEALLRYMEAEAANYRLEWSG